MKKITDFTFKIKLKNLLKSHKLGKSWNCGLKWWILGLTVGQLLYPHMPVIKSFPKLEWALQFEVGACSHTLLMFLLLSMNELANSSIYSIWLQYLLSCSIMLVNKFCFTSSKCLHDTSKCSILISISALYQRTSVTYII